MGPWGNARSAFLAVAQIDGENVGLTWNGALETGGVMVGKIDSGRDRGGSSGG
jgi:hypothetical protein